MRKSWGQLVAGVALVGVGVAGGWAAGSAGHGSAASATPPGNGITTKPKPAVFTGALVGYDSCSGLLDALHARGRAVVGPYGFGGGVVSGIEPLISRGPTLGYDMRSAASPTAGVASPGVASSGKADTLPHSTTNTQVADVDEPDVVKTDGRLLVSLDGQQLHVVDVRTDKLVATLALPHPGGELLLAGDRVVILTGASTGAVPGRFSPYLNRYNTYYYNPAGTTTATIVDLADPAAPKVVNSWTFDASESAARVVNGTIRLVLNSTPPSANWASPRDSSNAERLRATKINQALVDATPLDAWLPHWTSENGQSHRLSGCSAVAVPAQPKGVNQVGLVTVVSLDPTQSQPGAGTSVLGGGDTVYAEGHHLYVATPTSDAVQLLEFDLTDPAQARFLAAGTVPGELHDSYALSEYADHLRVTTTTMSGQGSSVTGISVLSRQGDRLVQVGTLNGLGSGEQVYAVRYNGDRGYVVTFQRVDPLHVIDLSNPLHPVLRGTLSMPGYSSQLVPLPGHKLLGVGQAVQPMNGFVEPDGLQLSLFDVTNASHPQLLKRAVVPGAYSNALNDPHALTVSPNGDLVVLPSTNGLVGVRVAGDALPVTVAAFAQPYSTSAGRTVIAGQHLFELTDRGLGVRSVPGLTQTGWIAF